MKKLITVFCLLNLFILNINADEFTQDGSYTISLTCVNTPSYSVKIPRSINVSKPITTISFAVKGDIYADQKLNVIFDETATLSNNTKTETVFINQNKKSWTSGQLTNEYYESALTLSHDELSAGIWNGSLNVVIALQGAS